MSRTPRIRVAAYEAGNIHSVLKALAWLGAPSELADAPAAVRDCDALIIPGVGAFGEGMRQLRESGLAPACQEFAAAGKPVLGICLGMQLLFEESEEFGRHQGLGLIPGRVVPLPPAARPTTYNYRIPHIGWNELLAPPGVDWEGSILQGLTPGDDAYFVHSYVAVPASREHVLATTSYGGNELVAVVRRGRVAGCQFHPEKSRHVGLAILRNFIALAGS